MATRIELPEAVIRKAEALGAPGQAWLDSLDALVADLEREWGFDAGLAMAGGSGGFVAPVVTADFTEAVLKLSIPDGLEGNSPFATELETLRLGDGHGYVQVLRADEERRALLLERLGRPLAALALPVEAQIDVIATTVGSTWRPLDASTSLRTGCDQALFLRTFIGTVWEQLGRPCAAATVSVAAGFAESRCDAFDEATAVLVHGDAHPDNILEARESGSFKLIDPDGMRSEPAHDLAIPLRDWTDELLASPDPLEQGLAWCAQLANRSGVDPQPIWEWAFVERVSTGLFLIQLGDPAGRRFLEIAEAWTRDARP